MCACCLFYGKAAPYLGFPGGSGVKNPSANAGDSGSIRGSARSPGEGNGNPFQILAWEIPWMEEPDGVTRESGYDLETETNNSTIFINKGLL